MLELVAMRIGEIRPFVSAAGSYCSCSLFWQSAVHLQWQVDRMNGLVQCGHQVDDTFVVKHRTVHHSKQ